MASFVFILFSTSRHTLDLSTTVYVLVLPNFQPRSIFREHNYYDYIKWFLFFPFSLSLFPGFLFVAVVYWVRTSSNGRGWGNPISGTVAHVDSESSGTPSPEVLIPLLFCPAVCCMTADLMLTVGSDMSVAPTPQPELRMQAELPSSGTTVEAFFCDDTLILTS